MLTNHEFEQMRKLQAKYYGSKWRGSPHKEKAVGKYVSPAMMGFYRFFTILGIFSTILATMKAIMDLMQFMNNAAPYISQSRW